ncbi:PHP domain-containing protein [Chloroflexota bacterium]
MLKADLHIHTEYSFDCATSLQTIIHRCQKKGVGCVAVADHGTIVGALKLKEIAPFIVVVAEEVLTPMGEIMGMFLTEEVPSGISVDEAIARIKEQGGLVCLPHPFDYVRGLNQKLQTMESLASHVDVVEVYNARALPIISSDRKARRFAQQHGLLCSAGSDAHTPGEIGHAYVEMPEFSTSEEFRVALAQGMIRGRRSCPTVHALSMWQTMKGKMGRRSGK